MKRDKLNQINKWEVIRKNTAISVNPTTGQPQKLKFNYSLGSFAHSWEAFKYQGLIRGVIGGTVTVIYNG